MFFTFCSFFTEFVVALLLQIGLRPSSVVTGIFVEILCLVGRLSLNSLIACAIPVREEPKLHVSRTSETSQT